MEHSSRSAIHEFDVRFRRLHDELKALVSAAGDEDLFREAEDSRKSMMPHSIGSYAIRSAAAVEQTMNGLTVRLWDDPFEWTLPERLPTAQDLIEYFNEVEVARKRGFNFLRDDTELQKEIPAPVELKTLEQILTDTLNRSKKLLSEAASLLSKID